MKCVDASFIIRLVTTHDVKHLSNIYWQKWQQSNTIIVAPNLIMYEVTNGLYRYHKAGEISSS